MRLQCMEALIHKWALHEMHAGVSQQGSVDVWYIALTDSEEVKLDETPFCVGVADILKVFDQIIRPIVYRLARCAGMPLKVLIAYTAYIENLIVYNVVAGGLGTAYRRRCGVPQGCLFSMMMVALIMRPWILIMRTAWS